VETDGVSAAGYMLKSIEKLTGLLLLSSSSFLVTGFLSSLVLLLLSQW
jgi:hypothetical protein